MSRYRFHLVVFLVGLAAVCWIGAGYAGSNPLALTATAVVGACYLAGAFELKRYAQATAALEHAVAGLAEPPPALDAWLGQVPPGLRGAVRLRIEGERVALPGPALTPYLVGMLVLLGMLGTLLGMVATLKGTGAALDGAADLQAIRTSLDAPLKGLAFAFGTSIAGVSTSAMLGLLSALCRRERLHAAQALDARIATTLRGYSHAHQREEAFKLLQRQTETMPALVDRLEAVMTALTQHSRTASEQQLATQQAFLDKTQAAYARLADSVGQSLRQSAAEGAQAAGAALQPVMAATMAELTREAATQRETVTQAVQQQLDALASGLAATNTSIAETWSRALAEQRQAGERAARDLSASFDRVVETFEQRSTSLVEGVSARLEHATASASQTWAQTLAQHAEANERLAGRHQQSLAAAAAAVEQHAASLLRSVSESHTRWQEDWQSASARREEQRLAAWHESLGEMAAGLTEQLAQAATRGEQQQHAICETLARTASEISAQAQTQASQTIAEISRLVQAASAAPKAAADMVAQLREQLSESLARDTATLEERSRLLATVETLLVAVNHASNEQRAAIDALVATSADLLQRVGGQFAARVETETGKLADVAAQVTGGAVEVASLGEAFGAAVQLFGQANEKLTAHLQRIEAALEKSLARSDEQLAYYVAQAREVIDLSMMSHRQIIDDLQRLSGPLANEAEAA